MKNVLIIAAVCLVVACLGWLGMLRNRNVDENHCINNMRVLDGAAVSLCLAHRLSPSSMLSMATLSPYLRPGTRCPSGQSDYPPFSVLTGPSCPNGHVFMPGVERPRRATASNRKLAGLYLVHGFTNLIDPAQPDGVVNNSQALRSETSSTASATAPVLAEKPWPGVPYSEVRAYAWPAKTGGTRVILPGIKLKAGVINDGGTLLSPQQVARLLTAVTAMYPYHPEARCYYPHNAFVFYDSINTPVAYIEICFDCSGYRAEPKGTADNYDLLALATIFDELKLPFGEHPLEVFKNRNESK
jgi:hypothetical protein